jgi:hypothetical protein
LYQPAKWQLAPAGNVDRHAERDGTIDLMVALHAELKEELGLSGGDIESATPLCIVRHPGIGVMDLCIAVTTPLGAAAIRHAHRIGGNDEYPEIAVVPRGEIPGFLAAHADSVAPQVDLFLQHYLRPG